LYLLPDVLTVDIGSEEGTRLEDREGGRLAVSSREYTRGATTTATTTGTVSPDYGAGSTVNANTTATTTVRHVEVDTNSLIVVGADYIYTVQDSTQRVAGC